MSAGLSTTARIAAAIGAGLAGVVISMSGAAGVAQAAKPCQANCHAPNPKPTLDPSPPKLDCFGRPCVLQPPPPPPPPPPPA